MSKQTDIQFMTYDRIPAAFEACNEANRSIIVERRIPLLQIQNCAACQMSQRNVTLPLEFVPFASHEGVCGSECIHSKPSTRSQ